MMPDENPRFTYASGETVDIGDIVLTANGRRAVVKEVLLPGSKDADEWNIPEGGILIEEDWWDGPKSLVMHHPDVLGWEEIAFVSRAASDPNTNA